MSPGLIHAATLTGRSALADARAPASRCSAVLAEGERDEQQDDQQHERADADDPGLDGQVSAAVSLGRGEQADGGRS